MNRRTALGGLCALATTGCLARIVPGSGPVVERELTVYEPGTAVYESAPDVTAPPRVTFEPDETRVRVVGRLFVGSSTCHEAALERVAYDGSSDALRVVVGSGEKPRSGDACTGDESVDAYRALITFDERLPDTVVAEETGGVEDTGTTVRNPDAGE